MKELIVNENNLQEKDITNKITKVKALILNNKNEILLANYKKGYQFPGGTKTKEETLLSTLKRELREEVGIEIKLRRTKLFLKATYYYKDYPRKDENSKIEINYFELKTNKKPNTLKQNLTAEEQAGNFRLEYINLNKVEETIINNNKKHGERKGISTEMLQIIKKYKIPLDKEV